jgi:hypothetical protein
MPTLHASHAALPIITLTFNALIAVEPHWLRGVKVPNILYYISTIITIISLYYIIVYYIIIIYYVVIIILFI